VRCLGDRCSSSWRRGDGTSGRSTDPKQGRSRGQPRPGRRAQTHGITSKPGKSVGVVETGGSGRRSDERRDNTTPPGAKDPWAEVGESTPRGRLVDHASRGARGSIHDEGSLKPLQGWEYTDLVRDLTPGTGRGGLNRATPRLEAVLGKPHCTALERGGRKRGRWLDEAPASPSKERRAATPDLRLCAPVLYSTVAPPPVRLASIA
jgi:hypothetical protein